MPGNIIVTAKGIMSIHTIRVWVNNECKAELAKNEKATIPLEKNSVISISMVAPLGEGSLVGNVTVSAANATVFEARYHVFGGALTLDEISSEKVCDYVESEEKDSGEKALMIFDGGVKDFLYLYEEYLVIEHKGVLNAVSMGIKGNKTIYYTDITSVQYKRPGMTKGYIQLSIPGGNENKGGVFSAMSDENTVAVCEGASYELEAQKVVDFINTKIREAKTNKSSPIAVQQSSAADEIKKFKELLDLGIITQEEFDAKKKQLLGL